MLSPNFLKHRHWLYTLACKIGTEATERASNDPQAVTATLLYLLASIPHPATHYAVKKTTTHMEVLQT